MYTCEGDIAMPSIEELAVVASVFLAACVKEYTTLAVAVMPIRFGRQLCVPF